MKKNSLKALIPVLFGFYIMGFCDIVGFSTSYVKAEFGLSETLAGLIPSMVFLWFLLLSVPVSLAMNKLGRCKMVIAGNAVTFIGMIVPLINFSFVSCLIAFALLGIGNTILQVSLNPLLSNVVDGKGLTSALTAGQVIKAISSFSGPFVATFAASCMGDWKMMFLVFAIVSVLSGLWLAFTSIEEEEVTRVSGIKEVFSVLKDNKVLVFFIGIIAVVGVDVGMNTLAPKMLMERCGLSVEQAGYGSSVYFFCRVLGSFLGTFLLTRMADKSYYMIHSILGLVVLCALAFASSNIIILLLLGLAGYSFSSIFSVIYSQALKHKPEYGNEISGLMITGVFGGAIVPPLMGLSADMIGSQVGSLLVIAVFAIYLIVCGFKLNK